MRVRADGIGSEITAILGPTNTGKTHRCIERMLEHESAMFGLPLRLLAREVYDKLTELAGENLVALVTGEEKRIPKQARFWICTVEAMPLEHEVDFLAVDEIQLTAHPTRGHIFTQRLLHARGKKETWFLGSHSCRRLLSTLVPTAKVTTQRRLSQLRHTGSCSLGRLPPRSAIVGFSVPQVYELAERIRARKGGVAVVLGALSPRTRNAQVAMFQAGEVEHLVATDAIGMGLNMDLTHVAFANLRKFDGRRLRALHNAELAQIAGRAGRHLDNGTFGSLLPCPAISDDAAHAIETHHFEPQRIAFWRNNDLSFDSLDALLGSLSAKAPHPALRQIHQVDDAQCLQHFSENSNVRDTVRSDPAQVRLVWEVCQIPDYRKLLPEVHHALLLEIYSTLVATHCALTNDWMATRFERLNKASGDIETLTARLTFVRTWSYVSQHTAWLKDPRQWQRSWQQLEDSLSDELHDRLVQRFVTQRKSPNFGLTRGKRNAPQSSLGQSPNLDGPFAQLAGLRLALAPLPAAQSSEAEQITEIIEAPHQSLQLSETGQLLHNEAEIGLLQAGNTLLRPTVNSNAFEGGSKKQVLRRLRAFTVDLVNELKTDAVSATEPDANVRGVLYQLEQNLGTIQRRCVLAQLSDKVERRLVELGVSIGRRYVWYPSLLKQRPLQIRRALCAAYYGQVAVPTVPLGRTSVAYQTRWRKSTMCAMGFVWVGPRIVRCDIAERIFSLKRPHQEPAEVCGLLGCSKQELPAILRAI